MSNEVLGQEMLDKLAYKKKNFFEEATPEEIKATFDYSVGYMKYLDDAKTEREAVDATIALIKAKGYTEYRFGETLNVGDKKYFNNRNKSIIAFKIGANNLEEDGIRLIIIL